MLKNNPYTLLEKEHVDKSKLSKGAREALSLFDQTLADLTEYPDNDTLKNAAEDLGEKVSELVEEAIREFKEKSRDIEAEETTKKERKARAEQIVKKAGVVLDELELCRQRLRQDREQKLKSGEIAPPKKKTITTRLRAELLKMAGMIPKKLKEDASILERTRKALMRFLSELKEIWGLDRIKPIEEELSEKFEKMASGVEKNHKPNS